MALVGIDLGTTYSRVGVWQNGRVEIIIPNDDQQQGNRTTPSYVAFTEREHLVGDDAAKTQGVMCEYAHNTIFDTKRPIGRKFEDPGVQSDMKGGTPIVEGDFEGETKELKAEKKFFHGFHQNEGDC